MNRAVWFKALHEVRWLLPAFVVLMFGFNWMFAWITSQIDLENALAMVKLFPQLLRKLSPVPLEILATYQGRLAFSFEHPVVEFGCVVWAIARASDAVSGPLGRGTLEMTLAQPVRRISLLAANAVVTVGGLALLALACFSGTCTAIALIPRFHDLTIAPYVAAAGNLCCTMLFVAGFTTLLSSIDRTRGRTIGWAVTFYVVSLVLKIVGRAGPPSLHWLGDLSFLAYYEPQRIAIIGPDSAALVLRYDMTLLSLGLVAYLLAAIWFCRRDLPAPV